jgi:hypothetical protein
MSLEQKLAKYYMKNAQVADRNGFSGGTDASPEALAAYGEQVLGGNNAWSNKYSGSFPQPGFYPNGAGLSGGIGGFGMDGGKVKYPNNLGPGRRHLKNPARVAAGKASAASNSWLQRVKAFRAATGLSQKEAFKRLKGSKAGEQHTANLPGAPVYPVAPLPAMSDAHMLQELKSLATQVGTAHSRASRPRKRKETNFAAEFIPSTPKISKAGPSDAQLAQLLRVIQGQKNKRKGPESAFEEVKSIYPKNRLL